MTDNGSEEDDVLAAEDEDELGQSASAEQLAAEEREVEEPRQGRLGVGHWIVLAVFSILLAYLIHSFLLQTYKIPSVSMYPTLEIGDHVLVNRFIYGFSLGGRRVFELRGPKRGDVVIFSRAADKEANSERFFVKRLAGLPGDTIRVKDHRLLINGVQVRDGENVRIGVSEASPGRNFGPLKLKADEYFVLGDNRANSEDSRFFGPIHRDQIWGRVFMIYWSWRREGAELALKWNRIGKRVE